MDILQPFLAYCDNAGLAYHCSTLPPNLLANIFAPRRDLLSHSLILKFCCFKGFFLGFFFFGIII